MELAHLPYNAPLADYVKRFALLGHSYGGFLALEYARRWPETLTHLVLVATSAGPVRAEARSLGSDSELREYFRGLWLMFFKGANKYWELFDAIKFSVGPYSAAFERELPAYDVRNAVAGLDEWEVSNAVEDAERSVPDVGHQPLHVRQVRVVAAHD